MHYKDKNLQIDIRCHTVFMNDQKIELSLKEFTVLKYLTELSELVLIYRTGKIIHASILKH